MSIGLQMPRVSIPPRQTAKRTETRILVRRDHRIFRVAKVRAKGGSAYFSRGPRCGHVEFKVVFLVSAVWVKVRLFCYLAVCF